VQLLEASFAGAFGAVALWAVLLFGARAGGLVFIAGFAAYTAVRQLLFRLRDIPRTTTHGPKLMLGAASAAALAATTALMLR